jgi:hypothetical protein
MADAVNSSIDIIRGYCDEGSTLQVEQTVPLQQLTGEQDAEGTCDVAILREGGTHLVIIDFKYGEGVMVYASELQPEEGAKHPNGQLAMYALGWLHKYGSIYDAVEKVTLVVLQPRMEWTDEYTISVDQLRAFEGVIREAAGAVEMERLAHSGGDELTLIPGDKQCRFCSAKAICPALKASLSNSLALVAEPSKVEHFEDLTLPKKAAAVKVDDSASNEKLAEFMRAVPLIEEAVKAVRAEVERRLFAGQEVPGFYLGVGRKGNRAWKDEEAVEELLRKKRIKVDEIFVKKLVSPPQAEKKLKDKPKVWAQLEPHIHQPEGKPSVCREGDSNPPYPIVSATEDFHNLDAPATIAKVIDARTGNGLVIETSLGETIIVAPSRKTMDVMKLAKLGEPVAPLTQLLEQLAQPALEDLLA